MNKAILISSLILILTSCGWFPNQRDAFIKLCKKEMQKSYSDSLKIDQACQCSQEKVEAEYTWEQFRKKSKNDEVQKLLKSCFKN